MELILMSLTEEEARIIERFRRGDRAATWWNVEDFYTMAEELDGKDWEKTIDRKKLKEAFEYMLRSFDPCIGINWDVIIHWVEECRIDDT